MAESPMRLLPAVTLENQHFWTGGAQGELRFLCCALCKHLIHPPAPVCPECLSRKLEVATVSGRGTVHTYTVNHALVPRHGHTVRDRRSGAGRAAGSASYDESCELSDRAGEDRHACACGLRKPRPRVDPAVRACALMEVLERRAAITGLGQSEVGRRLGRDPLAL